MQDVWKHGWSLEDVIPGVFLKTDDGSWLVVGSVADAPGFLVTKVGQIPKAEFWTHSGGRRWERHPAPEDAANPATDYIEVLAVSPPPARAQKHSVNES
jgi:hypothetical protein